MCIVGPSMLHESVREREGRFSRKHMLPGAWIGFSLKIIKDHGRNGMNHGEISKCSTSSVFSALKQDQLFKKINLNC